MTTTKEAREALLRRAVRRLDDVAIRRWLGGRFSWDRLTCATPSALDVRVESFIRRTIRREFAHRKPYAVRPFPDTTAACLGECSALLEECAEATATGASTRRAFEALFERIHLLRSAESDDVEFPELGPIHLLLFGPDDAMPADFVALTREPDRSPEQRTKAIEKALVLVASDAERERLRALAASGGIDARNEPPQHA